MFILSVVPQCTILIMNKKKLQKYIAADLMNSIKFVISGFV